MASATCYISAAFSASTTRSIRQDLPAMFSTTAYTQTLSNRKALRKWAAAVAPADPDVPLPPLELSKLRKYWGGNNEDPLTSDGFIWNKDFMDRFKKMIQDPDSDSSASDVKEEETSGFLSLNRVMNLDSLEVDLSEELAKSVKSKKLEKPVKLATRKSRSDVPKWRLAPTRREQDKWDRASKATTGGTDVLLREIEKPRGDPLVLAAQSREQYFELKNKMQTQTVAVGAVGLVSSLLSYSPEIAASFGIGLLGSLMYIRMLGSTVDGMADGARGAIKGSVNQPRLLVPVALVMIYNRWNGLLVPEYGLMHLELIPMLVGFFTYKIATFIQAIEESLPTNTKTDQIS